MIISVVTVDAPDPAPATAMAGWIGMAMQTVKGVSITTMLTQTGGSFGASSRPAADRHSGTANAVGGHLTTIKQACWFICNVLLAGGVLAGLITLKTAAFVWHLHP